jgi:hypothetical protein
MLHQLYVTPTAGVWTVKDDDEGCLCVAPSRDQALRVANTLAGWFAEHGRPAEVRIERSFAPDPRRSH